jgi:hypothetical protein
VSYRYRLFDTDGNDIGETRLAVLFTPGDEIVTGAGEPNMRVVDVVAVMDAGSPYVGLLTVELDE